MPVTFTTIGGYELVLRTLGKAPAGATSASPCSEEGSPPVCSRPPVSPHKQPTSVAGGDLVGTYSGQPIPSG